MCVYIFTYIYIYMDIYIYIFIFTFYTATERKYISLNKIIPPKKTQTSPFSLFSLPNVMNCPGSPGSILETIRESAAVGPCPFKVAPFEDESPDDDFAHTLDDAEMCLPEK